MRVNLTDVEFFEADLRVIETAVDARERGCMETVPSRRSREFKLIGALGEIAFAAMMGMPRTKPAEYGHADFQIGRCRIDVKTSSLRHPCLLITPPHNVGHEDANVYVSMRLNLAERYVEAQGWQWKFVALGSKYLRVPPQVREACFMVPVADLLPMSELRQAIERFNKELES